MKKVDVTCHDPSAKAREGDRARAGSSGESCECGLPAVEGILQPKASPRSNRVTEREEGSFKRIMRSGEDLRPVADVDESPPPEDFRVRTEVTRNTGIPMAHASAWTIPKLSGTSAFRCKEAEQDDRVTVINAPVPGAVEPLYMLTRRCAKHSSQDCHSSFAYPVGWTVTFWCSTAAP